MLSSRICSIAPASRFRRPSRSARRAAIASSTRCSRASSRLYAMKTLAIGACAAFALTGTLRAQVTFNSVRIAAVDTVAVAKFYQSAFGMQEVNRIEIPGGPEVFVNFGATVEAARANKGAPVVIMHRESDAVKDPIAHVIFNVTNMTATVAAIKAA